MTERSIPKHMLIETHSSSSDTVSLPYQTMQLLCKTVDEDDVRVVRGVGGGEVGGALAKFLTAWWQADADASRTERWSCDTLGDVHPGWIRYVSVPWYR